MRTNRGFRKQKIGKVVNNKAHKTISVLISRAVRHPIYGKYINKSTKIMAHDEANQSGIGDIVKIMETRPISKNKCWRLVEIVAKAK